MKLMDKLELLVQSNHHVHITHAQSQDGQRHWTVRVLRFDDTVEVYERPSLKEALEAATERELGALPTLHAKGYTVS